MMLFLIDNRNFIHGGGSLRGGVRYENNVLLIKRILTNLSNRVMYNR